MEYMCKETRYTFKENIVVEAVREVLLVIVIVIVVAVV